MWDIDVHCGVNLALNGFLIKLKILKLPLVSSKTFNSDGFLNVLTEILTEEQKKEELEKLYSAIGYSEGEVITAFPKEVDPILNFSLFPFEGKMIVKETLSKCNQS